MRRQALQHRAMLTKPLMLALPYLCGAAMVGVAQGPRAKLLEMIAPLERGFKASGQQRKEVSAAIETLAASTSQQFIPDISGDWELVYTDAPDILGLESPLTACPRIGQQISEVDGTIANVIEYQPRIDVWPVSLFSQAKGDLLQQRVVTSFTRRADEPTKVDLKIKGAAFAPKQILGVSLSSLPPLRLEGPLQPPFGTFEVLYCEGPEGPPTGDAAALDPETEGMCELDELVGCRVSKSSHVIHCLSSARTHLFFGRSSAFRRAWVAAPPSV